MILSMFNWKAEGKTEIDIMSDLEEGKGDDWSDSPGTTYSPHSHEYNKTLYCLEGKITFSVDVVEYPLSAGQGLYLPKGTVHSAVSGGVRCVEVYE